MEPPPPTPLSETPLDIFINSDGSPLAIFAEASHISNRPQLVRKLRRHGAAICSDPKDAQVILINPESSSGRLLGRNWGQDANKVVLDVAWVNKCFTSEKALLSEDAYGGYLFVDDGRSIEDDGYQESDDEIAKSPLPTPRNTPVEPVKPAQPVHTHTKPDEILNPHSASQAAKVPHDLTNASSSRATEATSASIQPPFNMDMATMAQFLQQLSSAAVPPASQIPMMMNPATMLPMFQPGFTFTDPHSSMQTHPFWLAVQDAVRKGLYPSMPSPFSHAAFPQAQAPPVSPVQEQVLPYPPIPAANESTLSINAKGKQKVDSPPAKRRKTSYGSFEEAITSSNKSNDPSIGSPSIEKKIFTTSTNTPLAFFVQVGGYNRFSLVQSIKKNGGAIVSNVGEADYVVLFPPTNSKADKAAHDRFLAMAESGGQPAVSQKFITDCIENQQLIDTDAYEFVSNNNKRKRREKLASPDEPESEDDDNDDVSIQAHEAIKKQQEEKERKRVEKCRREMERRKRIREEKEKERQRPPPPQTPVLEPSNESFSQPGGSNGPRSPTPPAERTQMLHGTRGHFRFTEQENAYAITYGKILIERNHEISFNAVGTAIHKKMSHHTLKSWRTHLASLTGFDFDDWQKRAGIAYRKKQKQQSLGDNTSSTQSPAIKDSFKHVLPEQLLEFARYDQSPSPFVQGSIPQIPVPVAKMELTRTTLEDDLVVISNFFAECNDDQTETEEAIWAKLTAQASCKTEVTWEEFYQRHSDEVQRRYQKLVDAKVSKANGA